MEYLILGFGGLTVLSKIKKNLTKEDLIYLGDTLHFPYGDKSQEEIIEFSIKNVDFLISKNVKAIIIACGTATSQALEVLKQKYEIPIFGIIEPTVLYIKSLDLKEIGVIATEGTIRSGAWESFLRKRIPDISVVNKACPMLATVAEEGRARSKEGIMAIKEYMKIFKERHIGNIILGCTHYPIYEPIIREELGYDVNLVNTGTTVSNYLKGFLKENNLNNNFGGSEKIFLSKHTDEFKNIAKTILNEELEIFSIYE